MIAIEPWFLHTTDEIFTDADGWTLRSADGSRGAHMEHTVAITADGPLVLTARDYRDWRRRFGPRRDRLADVPASGSRGQE